MDLKMSVKFLPFDSGLNVSMWTPGFVIQISKSNWEENK